MKARRLKIWTTLFLVITLSTGLLVLNGCKKSEEQSMSSNQEMQSHEGDEHAAMKAEPAADTASTIEQKTCPIMGGAINTALFTEYKGKKVYFCCDGCKEKFEAEPEKYIAKLPQFKNEN